MIFFPPQFLAFHPIRKIFHSSKCHAEKQCGGKGKGLQDMVENGFLFPRTYRGVASNPWSLSTMFSGTSERPDSYNSFFFLSSNDLVKYHCGE